MRTDITSRVGLLLSLLALLAGGAVAAPLGTAFTYQGRLTVGNDAADGRYDFSFALYDSADTASQFGPTLTNAAVLVSSGLFTATLDFGSSPFTGDARWLEIGVRTNGNGTFTALNPRQLLAPTPYAISASTLVGTLPATQLGGTYPSQVTLNNPENSFTGNGSALTGVNASALSGLSASSFWQLGGNAGTTVGMNFLGTSDAQPLELKVGGQRVLRFEGSGNIIAGHSVNSVSTSASYSVVCGGSNNVVQGTAATIGGGFNNVIQTNSNYGNIGGGRYNSIQTNCYVATIGGGERGTIQSGADATTIAGGSMNTILTNADYATIGGGYTNTVSANSATIGGGRYNDIQTNAISSTISGGHNNSIRINADVSTVGGGGYNVIQTDADAATIAGGSMNTIQANADYATISGGSTNTIGTFSGTIGGGNNNTIQTNANNSTIAGGYRNTVQNGAYNAAIGGGYYNIIQTNAQHATIPGGYGNTAGGALSFAAGYGSQAMHDGTFMWSDATYSGMRSWAANLFVVRASGGTHFFSNSGATVGTYLPAGGNGFSPMSDRNVKENFKQVDPRAVLEKVAHLPVTEWNLVSQPENIRHIGPMAQDFKAAFGLGEDDRHISTTDADGVALAAIQGLWQIVSERERQVRALEKDVEELKAVVNSLLQQPTGGRQ